MLQLSGRAKGAAKGSCGETVVQKGVFGESVSSLPPEGLLLKHLKGPENHKGAEKKRTPQKHPFGRPFLRTTPSPLLWRALKLNAVSGMLSPSEFNSAHTTTCSLSGSEHVMSFCCGQVSYQQLSQEELCLRYQSSSYHAREMFGMWDPIAFV